MKRSFTLLELMVVITIVGIIASLAVPNFLIIKARVLQSRMRNTLSLISKLEQAFYAEHGHYGPGPDNRRYNYIRYYPYTYKNGKVWIRFKPDNLGLVMPKKRRYYYYIYWYKWGNYDYFYAIAYASKWMKNDIDGDRTPDYWYVSSFRPEPTALINDLKR